MTQVSCPLVGMHFHPPAKALLSVLPRGCPLTLRLEPSNPYDANAIMVWVRSEHLPEGQYGALADLLLPFGFIVPEMLGVEEWHLGYIKREYAEDLAPRLVLMSKDPSTDRDFPAQLGFAPNGSLLVLVDLEVLGQVPAQGDSSTPAEVK